MGAQIYEDNPFEDEIVAKEWINSIENEHGMIRDKELYPKLKDWVVLTAAEVIVEIGSGQGICAEKSIPNSMQYIGIEPSETLVKRAEELYLRPNRKFIIGNAYNLPLPDLYADAAFSINVWFHLRDLPTASKELQRILKPGARFCVMTVNPNMNNVWESFYFDYKKEGNAIDGKVMIPVNPLSRNVFYQHTLEEILEALKSNNLVMEKIENFGFTDTKDDGLFINIIGHKN
ncbi:MAG: methyltransferase domain-containing protein [Candidatus Sungbacteria bacterium]|uniref:Methyltransferase domain-containing protein n=1 Tax=Candidatus Sungiibacteriota bacterium TaxID=2750080 RepID=A0A9D6LRJ3_9BACT|nr:methyltransferase domain-containing protein [Candidatus Sungbacteria bacterium]